MAQYIDKAVLVAEIEKRIEVVKKQREDMLNVQCYTLADNASVIMVSLKSIQDFIDTIEVKNVDSDKELEDWLTFRA